MCPGGEGRAGWVLLAARGSSGGSAPPIRTCLQGPCCHPVLLWKNVVNPQLLCQKLSLPKASGQCLPQLGTECSCVHPVSL